MLNFGLAGVLLGFAALGSGAAWLRRLAGSLDGGDPLRMLVPFLINGCVLALINDSDIQVVYLVKNGTLPFLLVAACYRWRGRPPLALGGGR